MTRTVNSIDNPAKKLEVESSRRIEGTNERVGLRHEANSDLTEGEKKIMQSAQVAANHNDEGSKVAGSGSKTLEVKKMPLSESSDGVQGESLRLRGGEDLNSTMLKSTIESQKDDTGKDKDLEA